MTEEDCTCTPERVMQFLQKMAAVSADPSLCDPESDSIYLCGNSLGLMPKATERIMQEQLDKWAKMGVFGHTKGELPWAHCDEHALEGVAQLAGAKPEEIALCNGLTVNIHVLLVCLAPREGEVCLRKEDILSYIEEHGEEIAVIFLPGIQNTKISCKIITPSEFHERGCQLSLQFSISIDVIYKELVKRGVAVDKRYPDVIRVTPVHLYNNYVDCRRFITALQEACAVAEASL
ncbi:unnamed protein product [Strongylus vulgaris]|uniref:Kynureninase n=1 Tax=Strongylus vulgaris TaxID=40348 RepID=A0A3P7J0V5_STRVU|nr:unnamed protein product [Strongylus vulgaris]